MYSFIEFIKQFRDGCILYTPLAFRLSPYFDTYAILKIFIFELYLNGSKLVHVWFVILRYLISNFKGLKLFATASKQVETWEVNWDSDKYVKCYIKNPQFTQKLFVSLRQTDLLKSGLFWQIR